MISYLELQSLEGNNAERFAFIDFKLRFTGVIKRVDLRSSFGLAEASASRLLTAYAKLRPNNFKYDAKRKVNTITLNTFQPLIHIDPLLALGMLAHGFNKNKLIDSPLLPYTRIGNLSNTLNIEDVSAVTRAMFNEHAIECVYVSGNSSNHNTRTLLPLSLLFDGRSWIYRAYQRSEKEGIKFKNFNFSRTTCIKELSSNSKQSAHESLAADFLWNEKVSVLLELHPSLTEHEQKSVRLDFGMPDGESMLVLQERAALLWILERRWLIDKNRIATSSTNKYYNFHLKNSDVCLPYLS